MDSNLYNRLKALKSSDRYPYIVGTIDAIMGEPHSAEVKVEEIQDALDALDALEKEKSK